MSALSISYVYFLLLMVNFINPVKLIDTMMPAV